MFSDKSSSKTLKKYSPPWSSYQEISDNVNINDLPSIYELLYKNKPNKVFISIRRNSRVGSYISLNIFYKKYFLTFEYLNKDSFSSYVSIGEWNANEVTNKYYAYTDWVSYEMTNSVIRLIPKQLRKTFRNLLLVKSVPRKWKSLINCLKDISSQNKDTLKYPTILFMDLLQKGANTEQLDGGDRIHKTYFYFKV